MWDLSGIAGQILRAADCKLLAEKPVRIFCQKEQPTGLLNLFFESVFLELPKRKPPLWGGFLFGDPERTRTVDLQRDRLAC